MVRQPPNFCIQQPLLLLLLLSLLLLQQPSAAVVSLPSSLVDIGCYTLQVGAQRDDTSTAKCHYSQQTTTRSQEVTDFQRHGRQ